MKSYTDLEQSKKLTESSYATVESKEAFRTYCEGKAKEWLESKEDIFRKEIESIAKNLGIKNYTLEIL